jgi:SAM-dependent methyltransferase
MNNSVVTDYDEFAARYARHTAKSLFNAGYERPALLSALGPVAGKRVLDLGCASGELMVALLEQDVREVIGLDVSHPLLTYAATQTAPFGNRARTIQANLNDTLPSLGSFDAIACSLVLHYLRDWHPLLSALKDMLNPRGRLVFSTHHPEMTAHRVRNYFDICLVDDVWAIDGVPTAVHYYHRPLEAILAPVLAVGLTLTAVIEPHLPIDSITSDNPVVTQLATSPVFLIVSAVHRISPSP